MTANPPPDDAQPEPEENLDEVEASRAPFLEHLQELRVRLWRAILGVLVAFVGCFAFATELRELLTAPLYSALTLHDIDPTLYFRTIGGPFFFDLKAALLGGIFFGVPVILWQSWQFVAPGLYKNERRIALPFVISGTACFFLGAGFAYSQVLPGIFDFLIGYGLGEDATHGFVPQLDVEDYLSFTVKLLIAFGIAFEMPVAIGILSAIGLVTHTLLLKYWRYSVVLAFIFGAFLTPPDPFSQVMLAGPLTVMYFISVGVAYLIGRRRGDPDAEVPEA
jgi:sec-independent protein translocase protein TatC